MTGKLRPCLTIRTIGCRSPPRFSESRCMFRSNKIFGMVTSQMEVSLIFTTDPFNVRYNGRCYPARQVLYSWSSVTAELLGVHSRGCTSIRRRTTPLPYYAEQIQTFTIKDIHSTLMKHKVSGSAFSGLWQNFNFLTRTLWLYHTWSSGFTF